MYKVQCTKKEEKYVAGKGEMHFHPHLSMQFEFNACWEESSPRVFLKVEMLKKKAFPDKDKVTKFFHGLALAALLENRAITHHAPLDGLGFELIYSLPKDAQCPKSILAVVRKDVGAIQQKLSEWMKSSSPFN